MTSPTVIPAWLPRRPLAADSKSGPYRRMSPERALRCAYVESNPLVMRSLVVTDHDGGDAQWVAELAGMPTPTWTALNPHTGAGHVVYALESPVCLSDAARRRPVNLLARVEQGLVTVLGGDVAYNRRITKNPLHASHVTLWGEELHRLRELAAALGDVGALPDVGSPRRRLTASVVGRNVAVFDHTRAWSYKAIRRYWGSTLPEWENACELHASHANDQIGSDFTAGPLSTVELGHIVRSIARWTWRHTTRDGWNRWAENRRNKSKQTRARRAEDLATQLRAIAWED